MLTAALVVVLAECGGSAHAQAVRIIVTPPVIVVPPPPVVVVAPPVVVVAPDNYVYYPSYGVYYNTTRHQYAYLRDSAWVSAPTPFGVSAEVVLASPSVVMDFHDDPSHHHDEMLRRYPRNWAPDRSHDGDHDRDRDGDRDRDHDDHKR